MRFRSMKPFTGTGRPMSMKNSFLLDGCTRGATAVVGGDDELAALRVSSALVFQSTSSPARSCSRSSSCGQPSSRYQLTRSRHRGRSARGSSGGSSARGAMHAGPITGAFCGALLAAEDVGAAGTARGTSCHRYLDAERWSTGRFRLAEHGLVEHRLTERVVDPFAYAGIGERARVLADVDHAGSSSPTS